jgi:hypothetical protein
MEQYTVEKDRRADRRREAGVDRVDIVGPAGGALVLQVTANRHKIIFSA